MTRGGIIINILARRSSSALSKIGLFHLGVVYVVWSTTYLAIRVMVHPGSGISYMYAGVIRTIAAGLILLLFARVKNHRISLSLKEFIVLTITGILFWGTGNGLLLWAEQNANSGFAALVLASTPIMVAFLDSVLSHKIPSWILVVSLIVSFCGLGFLMVPSLSQGESTQLVAGLGLLMSALSSAGGSIIIKRYPMNLSSPVISGYQHLLATPVFFILLMLFPQPLPHPDAKAWLALVYLIIFGSVIGYTSCIFALKLLPINVAMTYAYINPVMALFLGWLILGEAISIWTLLGAGLVILGVIGVFRVSAVTSPPQSVKKGE